MYPNEIKDISQAESLIKEHAAVLLYFYNDKCAPCISLRPKVLELLCDRYPEMNMHFINTANHPEVAAHFNCFSNPTLLIYFDGKEYRRLSKYIAIPQLSEEIKRPYFMLFEDKLNAGN